MILNIYYDLAHVAAHMILIRVIALPKRHNFIRYIVQYYKYNKSVLWFIPLYQNSKTSTAVLRNPRHPRTPLLTQVQTIISQTNIISLLIIYLFVFLTVSFFKAKMYHNWREKVKFCSLSAYTLCLPIKLAFHCRDTTEKLLS